MKVTLLCVGRVGEVFRPAVADFEGRAGRYWKLVVTEVKEGARGRRSDPLRAVLEEEKQLVARLPREGKVVALDREGSPMGSPAFAHLLEAWALASVPEVVFVIGGAFGLGRGILARADLRLSLSGFTLPHELARLVLVEQLYRAGTLMRGEPYHKGPLPDRLLPRGPVFDRKSR